MTGVHGGARCRNKRKPQVARPRYPDSGRQQTYWIGGGNCEQKRGRRHKGCYPNSKGGSSTFTARIIRTTIAPQCQIVRMAAFIRMTDLKWGISGPQKRPRSRKFKLT